MSLDPPPYLRAREWGQLQTLEPPTLAAALEVFEVADGILAESPYRLSLPAELPCKRKDREQFGLFIRGREPIPGAPVPIPFDPWKHACRRNDWHLVNRRARVTDCDGFEVLSNHQPGQALDAQLRLRRTGAIVWHPGPDDESREVFLLIVAEFKRRGFEWGGDWPKPRTDYPHFQLLHQPKGRP